MKGKKIIVPVMLASLVGAPVAVLNTAVSSNAHAYSSADTVSVVGPEIKLTGYQSKYKKGDSVTIPSVVGVSGNLKVEVSVFDPLGEEVFKDVDTRYIPGESFSPRHTGTYSFKYSLYEQSSSSSAKTTIVSNLFDEVNILVYGDEYALDNPTNSYHVVPAEMKYVENRKVTFPVPEVLKNDAELSTLDGTIELVVTKTGESPVTVSTYVAKDATENTTGEAYFTHTFTSAGKYRYKYQYRVGGEVVATTESKSFWLKEDTDVEDVTLDFSTLSQISTSGGEVGKTIKLPEVKVFDKDNKSKTYDAYTKIKVTYIGNEPVSSREVELEEDGFSFIPKYTGSYQVEYLISIPNMNGLSVQNPKKFIIEDVTDKTSPELYLTNSFNVAEDGTVTTVATNPEDVQDVSSMSTDEAVRTIGDMSYVVDSYYRLGTDDEVKVAIPAGYVTDNHAGINDITVTRVLYKKGNSGNTFKLVKSDDVTEESDATKVAYYTFSKTGNGAGEYVVRYTVEDDSTTGNPKTYSYYITIAESTKLGTDWVPQISMDNSDNIPVSVDKADLDTIKFNKSTATDKHDGKIYDEKLEMHTYYVFGDSEITTMDDSTFAGLTTKKEIFLNDESQYEVKLNSEVGDHKYLYFITTAKNSYNDKTAYAFKTVKINNPSQTGDSAPEFKLGGGNRNVSSLNEFTASAFNTALINRNKQEDGVLDSDTSYTLSDNGLTPTTYNALFDQGNTVILPDMTFSDASEDMVVSVYVTYESNDGKLNKINITSYERTNWESGSTYYSTISNASFVADYAKMYTITYVARDVNNHFTSRSFGVYVNDTEAPTIIVENNSKFAENVEVGDWFNVPSAYVEDNGERDDSLTTRWSVEGATGTYQTNKNGFRPLKPGTYYVVYKTVDAAGNVAETYAKQYPVTVVAEENPVITLVTKNYEEEYDWDYTNRFVYFAVPKAKASDKLGTVTVGTPVVKDGNSQTVDQVGFADIPAEMQSQYNESDYYFYKANSQGKYTATYTAKNSFGNSSNTTVTFEIGDCDAPVVSWLDKENNFKAEVNEGDTWQFKMSMINIEDNLDETIDPEKITITMTDPDGKTVDNGDDYTYTFNKVGSYTFKIVVKDKAGNSTYNNYSYTITVKAKDANSENKNTVLGMSPALGTTLIVLSVVMLGGVVVYFVLSSNKAKKSTNSKNKNRK